VVFIDDIDKNLAKKAFIYNNNNNSVEGKGVLIIRVLVCVCVCVCIYPCVLKENGPQTMTVTTIR